MISFGEMVRRKRLGIGWGLRHAAHRLGITPGYLSRIEHNRNEQPPSARVLNQMILFYGLDRADTYCRAGRLPGEVERRLLGDVALVRRIIEEEQR